MNPLEAWGASGTVTLRTVIRHAGELLHPKTTTANYPILIKFPSLQTHARALVLADQAGEPTSTLQALALDLLAVMRDARASQDPKGKSTRPATEVLTRPQQLRDRDEQLRDLHRKARASTTNAPMPALFDLPTKPGQQRKKDTKPASTFFTQGATR